MLLRVRGPGSEWLHDGSGGGGRGQNAFSPKISRCATQGRRGGYLTGGKFRMRKELRRPFPMNNTGRTWKLPLRTRGGGGRLHAPSRRIHDGSNGGSGPGPRSSPFRMRSSAAPGACAHAGHASRTLFANAAAAIFLHSLSNAAIFLRRICLCSLSTAAISLCRYYVGHNATAAILRRYSLLQLYSTVDITATAAILTSHTHNVLPTHLTPSSLKVSHRSSSLPP